MTALLLDHLWQSSIFAGSAGLLVLALQRNGAEVRFWLWFAASMKFLVPFAAITALGIALLPPIVAPAAAPKVQMAAPFAKPFSAPALRMRLTAAPAPSTATRVEQPMPAVRRFDFSLALRTIWAAGFLFLALRWLLRWVRVRAALRSALDMPVEAPIAVKFAASRLEPGLVGILRPVILLPQGIEQQLSPAEFKAVLAHELCHWRRRDNLLAALHMLVEALFWFFPLVWWLGARLNAERERACDESVVSEGNDPERYAEGILKVCRAYLQSPLACVSGVSGAGLKQRIDAIMQNRVSLRLSGLRKILLGLSASASIIAPLVLGLVVAPMAHAPAQAKAAVMAALDTGRPRIAEAPAAETVILREPDTRGERSLPENQSPLPVPEARLVAPREIPESLIGTVQVAELNLPAMQGNPGSDQPKTAHTCHNSSVYGRVISPEAVKLQGFNCFLGVFGVDKATVGPGGSPDNVRYGSCPNASTETPFAKTNTSKESAFAKSGLCKFDVTMNVQLADPADANKMQPGMTVRLAGNFRVASQNHVDYLIVSNATVLSTLPFAPAPGEKVFSFTCQPLPLIALSKEIGQALCVQDEIVANLNAEGPALSTAAHTFTRHPIRNTPVGGPDEITCRLGSPGGTRLPPPLNCARNAYWVSHPSQIYALGESGPFNVPASGVGMGIEPSAGPPGTP